MCVIRMKIMKTQTVGKFGGKGVHKLDEPPNDREN